MLTSLPSPPDANPAMAQPSCPLYNVNPCLPRRPETVETAHFLEILKPMNALGVKGIGEVTARLPFDEPRMLRFFAACEQVGFPIIFHTTSTPRLSGPQPGLLERNQRRCHVRTEKWLPQGPGPARWPIPDPLPPLSQSRRRSLGRKRTERPGTRPGPCCRLHRRISGPALFRLRLLFGQEQHASSGGADRTPGDRANYRRGPWKDLVEKCQSASRSRPDRMTSSFFGIGRRSILVYSDAA